jgi:acyl-CoA synthetase (AMP-forming)/AMP-acid ligase II
MHPPRRIDPDDGPIKRKGLPDLTAKAFDQDGFFNTGDLSQVKGNDCAGFFDRSKDIIRGGFNISAREVENRVPDQIAPQTRRKEI